MVIDDFHNCRMVPLEPEARAGMPTLPYVDGNSWVITGKRPVSTDPPSATVAAHPWARRPERWANSRPPALVCFKGAGLGESLTMIGKLLGRTQVQTTARYAHLARDSIQTAAARITGCIGGNLSPVDGADKTTG